MVHGVCCRLLLELALGPLHVVQFDIFEHTAKVVAVFLDQPFHYAYIVAS